MWDLNEVFWLTVSQNSTFVCNKTTDEHTKIFYMDKTIIQIIKMWTQALNWFEYGSFPTMKHFFFFFFGLVLIRQQKQNKKRKHFRLVTRFLKVVEKPSVIRDADNSDII